MKITVDHRNVTEYIVTKIYTLLDENIEVKIMTYGGIVTEIKVPDRNGNMVDVALGFSDPADYAATRYVEDCPYFGALIGRYANRIKNGRFRINEHEYQLDRNNGDNHLHGGYLGFDKKVWNDEVIEYFGSPALRLFLISEDGDQGYPGQLQAEVIYFLENNSLGIDYKAITTATTPVNLTWHGYFNLAGEGNGTILDHELMIDAHQITEVNNNAIPTGNIIDVKNTPFDFTTAHTIGSRISEIKNGYDHNYVKMPYGDLPRKIAVASSPDSGIRMAVWTTQPGVQLYTGNFLNSSLKGKANKSYPVYAGFCLETQHFPDSPNNPHFPKTLLEPGEVYKESTVYRFDTK